MNTHLHPIGLQPKGSSDSSQVSLERIESISLRTASFQSVSGDAYASIIEVGLSSTRYTIKSSPKDFAILHLLFLVGISLSFSSRTSLDGCSNDSTGDSIDIVKSGAILEENLVLLHISFIRNIFLKKYNITRFKNCIHMHIRNFIFYY
jgi:hypothetical protein